MDTPEEFTVYQANPSSDVHGAPPELEDALARIEQAKDNYLSLVSEMNEFLYDYVEGILKGFYPETESFVIRLRHPKDSNITGRPRVLVVQIVENLRNALDYMIFQFSVLNEPDLNERLPQFIISGSKKSFDRQAETALRYLTGEQKSFIEQIQPYNGNDMLRLLGEIAGPSKHRRLLSIRDNTRLNIYFGEITKSKDYPDHFVYPAERGCAVFAKPADGQSILLLEKYDAMSLLKNWIEHTEEIVRVSYCFFRGEPFNLTILKE